MKQSIWARRLLLFLVIGPLAILVFGVIMMLLWNNVLTPVLHVSTITFWQGLGIFLLSKLLFANFGGGPPGSSSNYKKQKMMWNHMTPEQKEKFKEEWKNRDRKWGFKSRESETEVDQSNAIQ